MHKIDNLKLQNFWEHIEDILLILPKIGQQVLHDNIQAIIYAKVSTDEQGWIRLVKFVLSTYSNINYFNEVFDYTETEKNELISLFHNDHQKLVDLVYNKNKGKYCKSGVVFGTPVEINELPEQDEKEIENEVTV